MLAGQPFSTEPADAQVGGGGAAPGIGGQTPGSGGGASATTQRVERVKAATET